MNSVNENHARWMVHSARHIEPPAHRPLRGGQCDFLCIQAMPLEPDEQTGSVRIEKLIQKNVTAKLVAKKVDSRSQRKNHQRRDRQEIELHEPTIRFERRCCLRGGGNCANAHRNCGPTVEPASLCEASITKQR